MFGFGKVFGVVKGVHAMPFALTPAYALPKREAVTLMETCVRCGENEAQSDCRYFETNDYYLKRGLVSGWYCWHCY